MGKQVKICPRCASTDIGFGDGTEHGASKDVCNKCDLNMLNELSINFPTIDEDEIKEFRKHLKEMEESDHTS